jgi:uncharacterized protein
MPDPRPAAALWRGRPRAARLPALDLLRGLALGGIVQINIQAYTWGADEVLAYLSPAAGTGERLLYFLQAALFEGKFYPLFAFAFGAGLALQWRTAARWVPERRLVVLGALGLAHAFLLYCGDVLLAYALCGCVLLAALSGGPMALRRLVLASALLAVAGTALPLLLEGDGDSVSTGAVPALAAEVHAVYLHARYPGQLAQRSADALAQQIGTAPLFWPQVLALAGLGALAARRGLLHAPRRFARIWRRATLAGLLLGLPASLAGAWMALQRIQGLAPDNGMDHLLLLAGSALSAAYLGALMLWLARQGRNCLANAATRALAAAGRRSLSNYLLQSLLMGVLLCGWGLGLGAAATRGELALLGLAVWLGQLALSLWMERRGWEGPVEQLWRRLAYKKA